ncbi:MAG: type I-C CRISPR-associated protein Cas5c [candidate division WOR-3 bacterium]
MGYGVKLEVWGDYASFNRPEMKVERVSYEFMTPSAARGILEAIYWKPQIRWVVDSIHVLSPIRFTQVRRNELDQRIPAKNAEMVARAGKGGLCIFVEDHRQQRASRILRDVRYGIEAHLEVLTAEEKDGNVLEHPEAKHLEAFKRRASKGQYFLHPYLGCREFPAHFRILGDDEGFPPVPLELQGDRDFGYVLWDIEFKPDPDGPVVEASKGVRVTPQARFFKAVMRDGVIQVPRLDETRG